MLIQNKYFKILILIFIAYSFSFATRLYWIVDNADVEAYKYNNEYILTTNDAFYWAEGAKDLVFDNTHISERSPVDSFLSNLTAIIFKIFPYSFETLLVYMPIIFSSLIVVPMILLGNKLNNLSIGFIAALVSSIAHSYYNRTIAGYLDTDFLNVVFPMFLIWSLYSAIQTKENKFIVFTAFEIILYRMWYPQSYALEFSFLLIIVVIAVYEYIKTKEYKYNIILISFMLLSMMWMETIYRVIIVLFLLSILFYRKDFFDKYIKTILFISVVLFIAFGGLNPIIGKLELYLFRDIVQQEGLGLHFYSVMNNIPEVRAINFETMGIRTSGNLEIFIISLVGYVFLIYKYRLLILTLPMLALGFLSLFAGLRFTMYAVPIMGLSIAFVIVSASEYLSNKFEGKFSIIVKRYLLILLTFLVLLPNLMHIKRYISFPTVTKDVVESLNYLNNIANSNDYTIGWWSFGYLIRYYTETNVLIDGGLHAGSDNFPISYIFTNTSQEDAVKMANLTIFYDKKRIENQSLENPLEEKRSFIEQMTIDNGYKNTNDFLNSISDINFEKNDNNVYLFLTGKMLTIFPRILDFSNKDLMTGKDLFKYVYYYSKKYEKSNDSIVLDNKVSIDLKNKKVFMSEGIFDIKEFITSKYEGKRVVNSSERFNDNGEVNIIYFKEFDMYLVIDNHLLNSLFIKLFVFEEYDENLLEPVILNSMAKIYKIKK